MAVRKGSLRRRVELRKAWFERKKQAIFAKEKLRRQRRATKLRIKPTLEKKTPPKEIFEPEKAPEGEAQVPEEEAPEERPSGEAPPEEIEIPPALFPE